MQFYKLINGEPDTDAVYYGVIKEAHNAAKESPYRLLARIELVEVPTDKEGVLELLNGSVPEKVLRTWRLTSRGGLLEITNGE